MKPLSHHLQWRGIRYDQALNILTILVAASLPWSTSLVGVFVVVWLLAFLPTIDPRGFSRIFTRSACILPAALFLLAAAGTAWSSAPPQTKLHALGSTTKLFILPLLIYHFERSGGGRRVILAFLISCTALLAMSWLVIALPQLTIKPVIEYGVPVKNYIDQSQEFALCAIGLLWPLAILLREKRYLAATGIAALALTFLINLTYVISSRTALVSLPFMLMAFAITQLRRRELIAAAILASSLATTAWLTSPNLRQRLTNLSLEYHLYETKNESTSVGLRLEFWRKSISFVSSSPIWGHGTGSIPGLFDAAAVGQQGASAEVISNPHNQVLNVAIQWGALGVLMLFAMWMAHLLMFRGDGLANCIGMLVVVQNIASSLFNSHLFDFHEGWMYVVGVGAAGGMLLANSVSRPARLSIRNRNDAEAAGRA